MSEQSTPEPEQPQPTEGLAPAEEPEATSAPVAEEGSRRFPLWAWIAAGVVIVAGAVVGVLAANGTFTPEAEVLPTPPAETVTATPPTPTVEPVAREGEPTAFTAALPDTVLDLALADFSPGGELESVKPIESYTLVYSDGGSRSVTVYAAQLKSVKAAERAFGKIAVEPTEQGEVSAGGSPVGELAVLADFAGSGETALVWRNTTALFVVVGEESLVRDVHTVFPL